VGLLREELDSHQSQAAELQDQLAHIEEENQRFAEKYVEVEQHNANLANLYVASYRLHSTLNRQEVLETIQEIIINLIGSEELGIFELQPGHTSLELVSSFGIEPERYRHIALGSGLIGKVAQTGETYLDESSNGNGNAPAVDEDHLTSCIPLKVDGKVTGAIAIFRLLQQKNGLQEVDYELFHLLATHAATALYCSRVLVGVNL
jgi:nitrate/nitrite-specific signal transduction histidine kinase